MPIELGQSQWDDLQVNLASVRLPASEAATNYEYKGTDPNVIIATTYFTLNQKNRVYFSAQTPHAWDTASGALHPHMHCFYQTAGAGNSVWTLDYSITNVNEVVNDSLTITKTFAASEVVGKQVIHSFGPITFDTLRTAGQEDPRISCVIMCRLSRIGDDVADTYANNIHLMAFDFHLLRNSNGSRYLYKK